MRGWCDEWRGRLGVCRVPFCVLGGRVFIRVRDYVTEEIFRARVTIHLGCSMLKKIKGRIVSIQTAVGAAVLTGSVAAHAALPASVGTTVTAIQTDGQDIFDLVFPVVGTFLGLSIVIKLFKRFGNKV
jgi:hypothetical protein